MTPYAFCRVCKYAANSAAMWPCRCCSRINRMEDYFTPADDDADDLPTHGDEIRALGNNGLAELIIERFHIHCGNCPAECDCIRTTADGNPIFGSQACKTALAVWLGKKSTGKESGV